MKYSPVNINNLKNWIVAVCGLLFFNVTIYAQDPIFSLQQTSPMNYNPAHVGNEDFTRVIFGYRNQYPSFSSAFTTYAASFDTYIPSLKSGAGIAVMHDKMGKIFNETTVSGAYSYNLRVAGDLYLRAGLQASLRLQSQDPSSLVFPDMIDASGTIIPNSFPYSDWNRSSFDISAGFALMTGYLKVGASAHNFSGKVQDSYNGIKLPDPLRVNAYITYDIILAEMELPDGGDYLIDFREMSLSPHIQYSQQYGYQILSAGFFFKAGSFFLGLQERQDIEFESFTVSLSLGLEYDRYGFGLSGDISQFGNKTNSLRNSAIEARVSVKLWDNESFYKSKDTSQKYKKKKGRYKLLEGMRIENIGYGKKRPKQYRSPY